VVRSKFSQELVKSRGSLRYGPSGRSVSAAEARTDERFSHSVPTQHGAHADLALQAGGFLDMIEVDL
jgi:hypothetical protein